MTLLDNWKNVIINPRKIDSNYKLSFMLLVVGIYGLIYQFIKYYKGDAVGAGNFSVNVTNSSNGDTIVNSSYINITGASIDRTTDFVDLAEILYIYLDIPSTSLPAAIYNTIQEWVILAETS